MRNIMLKLAFDGTGYAGWQRQTDQPTIQETLEERLSQITASPVALHGAGRTDAGVHALGMVASFETGSNILCGGLLKGLNSMLPADIRILAVENKDPQFHARISALGKLYVYQVLIGGICLPTERLYNYHIRHDLDIGSMRRCLSHLVGEHDFGCFEASGSRDQEYTGGRGSVRKITRADLTVGEGLPLPVRIEIAGDGFLRHMVRNIVGTILEVGAGRMSFDDLRSVIEGKDRSAAGPTAPARGLFLKEVYY